MKRILLAATIALLSAQVQAMCYSEGIRTGTVQKFSKKGMLIKSWEGELVMEGNKFNMQSGGNVWKFSVKDPTVATNIETATMNGKPVSLKYCQVYMTFNMTDTDYQITESVTH
jgi:hypothetical protein